MRKIVVSTDEQLMKCVASQVDVEVWIAGEFDSTVRIIDFNEESIKVEDGYYLHENCKLITFENYLRLT